MVFKRTFKKRFFKKANRRLNPRRHVKHKMRNVKPTRIFNIKPYVNVSYIGAFNGASSMGAIVQNNTGVISLQTAAMQDIQFFTCGMAYSLADTFRDTQYGTIWLKYKVNGIKLTFTPLNTMSFTSQNGGNGGLSCIMHIVNDYTSNTAPSANDTAGVSVLRQYKSYKMVNMTAMGNRQSYSRFLRPKLYTTAYEESLAFAAYAQMKNPWLLTAPSSSSSDTALYYGNKIIWEVSNPTATASFFNIKVEATYYLSFCDPH